MRRRCAHYRQRQLNLSDGHPEVSHWGAEIAIAAIASRSGGCHDSVQMLSVRLDSGLVLCRRVGPAHQQTAAVQRFPQLAGTLGLLGAGLTRAVARIARRAGSHPPRLQTPNQWKRLGARSGPVLGDAACAACYVLIRSAVMPDTGGQSG